MTDLSAPILRLIEVLAAADVDDYLRSQAAPANDPEPPRPNPPASVHLRAVA